MQKKGPIEDLFFIAAEIQQLFLIIDHFICYFAILALSG